MNKFIGMERVKNSTPFAEWSGLSLDERVSLVAREYGNYPLPVSKPSYKLDELKGMAMDFLAGQRKALVTKQKYFYFLHSGIVSEDCDIVYHGVHSKFKKTPPRESHICEIMNGDIFVYNREYVDVLKKLFDNARVSFFDRTS